MQRRQLGGIISDMFDVGGDVGDVDQEHSPGETAKQRRRLVVGQVRARRLLHQGQHAPHVCAAFGEPCRFGWSTVAERAGGAGDTRELPGDARGRENEVRRARVDGSARHAGIGRRSFFLREGDAALGFDLREPVDPVGTCP